MSDFGDTLRKIRTLRGMTQDDFAALLGTTKQVISRYENNQRSPKISVVTEYAEILGIPVCVLTGDAPLEAVTDVDSSKLSTRPPVELSAQERGLVEDFRSLNRQGQEYILQTMAMAATIYKNDPVSRMADQA